MREVGEENKVIHVNFTELDGLIDFLERNRNIFKWAVVVGVKEEEGKDYIHYAYTSIPSILEVAGILEYLKLRMLEDTEEERP